MEEWMIKAIGEALQKASLHGVELCRNAVRELRDQVVKKVDNVPTSYVEGLSDAIEMIETVFSKGLEIAIREKAKRDEQDVRKQ